MTKYRIEAVLSAMRARNYAIFSNDASDYNLNLVGVRSEENKANAFDDLLYVFWWYKKSLECLSFPITTDPGKYWLQQPMNVRGTAILCPGQYKGLWKIGTHKTYTALVQAGQCRVWRDNNRNEILDHTGGVDEGLFGINLHKAEAISKTVDKWSAGCQVFKNQADFNMVMKWVQQSAQIFGNRFTYTLLDETEAKKYEKVVL